MWKNARPEEGAHPVQLAWQDGDGARHVQVRCRLGTPLYGSLPQLLNAMGKICWECSASTADWHTLLAGWLQEWGSLGASLAPLVAKDWPLVGRTFLWPAAQRVSLLACMWAPPQLSFLLAKNLLPV